MLLEMQARLAREGELGEKDSEPDAGDVTVTHNGKAEHVLGLLGIGLAGRG